MAALRVTHLRNDPQIRSPVVEPVAISMISHKHATTEKLRSAVPLEHGPVKILLARPAITALVRRAVPNNVAMARQVPLELRE